jgi:hypothetical protein
LRWGKGETAAQIERVESLLQGFRGPLQAPTPALTAADRSLQPQASPS